MSNMYSEDFAFGKLYVFLHCLSVCIMLRVHSLSKCLSTVINVYNISFLVATLCLRFYSFSKCLFIVLVSITCLIIFTISVWTSVSICLLSVYTQCLQCLHCVPLSLFVLVSIHCLSVYIMYICLFLCKCLFIASESTLSTLCTSVSFCLNVYTLS